MYQVNLISGGATANAAKPLALPVIDPKLLAELTAAAGKLYILRTALFEELLEMYIKDIDDQRQVLTKKLARQLALRRRDKTVNNSAAIKTLQNRLQEPPISIQVWYGRQRDALTLDLILLQGQFRQMCQPKHLKELEVSLQF